MTRRRQSGRSPAVPPRSKQEDVGGAWSPSRVAELRWRAEDARSRSRALALACAEQAVRTDVTRRIYAANTSARST